MNVIVRFRRRNQKVVEDLRHRICLDTVREQMTAAKTLAQPAVTRSGTVEFLYDESDEKSIS